MEDWKYWNLWPHWNLPKSQKIYLDIFTAFLFLEHTKVVFLVYESITFCPYYAKNRRFIAAPMLDIIDSTNYSAIISKNKISSYALKTKSAIKHFVYPVTIMALII